MRVFEVGQDLPLRHPTLASLIPAKAGQSNIAPARPACEWAVGSGYLVVEQAGYLLGPYLLFFGAIPLAPMSVKPLTEPD